MDCANVKAEFGTTDYYLNRLIQRALAEPKPLLKIYEEECQRLPDISLTVTFKGFQTALQKYRMSLMPRTNPSGAHSLNHLNKQNNGRFLSLNDFVDHSRKHRRIDNSHVYQRFPHLPPDRFSPQGSKNGFQPPEATYPTTGTPGAQHTVHPPVEEETPPEFIEMSNNKFSGVYQSQLTGEQSVVPASCKLDGKAVDGAVQSSSPPNNNSVLGADNTSPLNVRCVKCITALVTCATMPCGHCCLCGICGQTVLSLKQVCPVCRKSINTVIGYSNLIYNVYR